MKKIRTLLFIGTVFTLTACGNTATTVNKDVAEPVASVEAVSTVADTDDRQINKDELSIEVTEKETETVEVTTEEATEATEEAGEVSEVLANSESYQEYKDFLTKFRAAKCPSDVRIVNDDFVKFLNFEVRDVTKSTYDSLNMTPSKNTFLYANDDFGFSGSQFIYYGENDGTTYYYFEKACANATILYKAKEDPDCMIIDDEGAGHFGFVVQYLTANGINKDFIIVINTEATLEEMVDLATQLFDYTFVPCE